MHRKLVAKPVVSYVRTAVESAIWPDAGTCVLRMPSDLTPLLLLMIPGVSTTKLLIRNKNFLYLSVRRNNEYFPILDHHSSEVDRQARNVFGKSGPVEVDHDPVSNAFMCRIKSPSPAILRAYRLTRYSAGDMIARVGSYPVGLKTDRARQILVLFGASNPCGTRRPDGWNARMTDRLRGVLHRTDFVEGSGRLGQWSEIMLMASMDPRRACVLARRFRQNAIIVISRRTRTKLMILPSNII